MLLDQNEATTSKNDPRMEFIADFTCKSLRLKPDKWSRMILSDEVRIFISKFFDKGKL